MNKHFGYIEGYYGRELTWIQRLAIITQLSLLSMNTYVYAPKEDPYHRLQWRLPYPATKQKLLQQLINYGKRMKVEFVPALAPGLSYDYLSQKDYQILLDKIEVFLKMGVTTIALLMDDIPETLPHKCRHSFSSLGGAHAQLLTALSSDILKISKNAKLWFCPTVYTDQFVKGSAIESSYLKDLASAIPPTITVMWTGPQVVSEKLNRTTMGHIIKLFKGHVVIWDNFYANDYAPLRLFIGPYTGREYAMLESIDGLLINPTGLFHTDRFLLSLFADFIKNKKATVCGWERVAGEFHISKTFNKIRKFFISPFTNFSAKDFAKSTIKKYGDIFEDIIVQWQNPLKPEWYPYIESLHLDLKYLQMEKTKIKSWASKRYPPVIARRMIEN